MPTIYLNQIEQEIELNISPKVWSKLVIVKDQTLEEYMKEPDYNKLQAELQTKYWFLFKEKVNNILNK